MNSYIVGEAYCPKKKKTMMKLLRVIIVIYIYIYILYHKLLSTPLLFNLNSINECFHYYNELLAC